MLRRPVASTLAAAAARRFRPSSQCGRNPFAPITSFLPPPSASSSYLHARHASSSNPPPPSADITTNKQQQQQQGREFISVDKRGLYEEVARLSAEYKNQKKEKSPLTPLGKLLHASIKQVGPISLADFMDVCLSHPEYGYYMNRETAKIGKAGDFVTAPEISQMFGELLGVWGVATWEKLGMPKDFRMVEIGPGKGTLMQDVLRVSKRFGPFQKAMGGVHMVETSRALRKVQAEALGAVKLGKGKGMTKNKDATQEPQEKGQGEGKKSANKGEGEEEEEWEVGGSRASRQARWTLPSKHGIDWHDDIRQVPTGGPLIIYAQELLDALPVHQFEYTEEGWREKLIDMDEDPETPHHFKFTLAKGPTPAVVHLEETMAERLQAILDAATAAAAASGGGDGAGEEVKADGKEGGEAKKEDAAATADGENKNKKKGVIGTSLEVCPLALLIVQQVAERVGRTGGAALFVDYGEDHAQGDSLRGLKRHAHVDALSEPGDVDLSTDVDFAALKDAIKNIKNVRAFGPMPQGQFLSAMGIETRLEALLEGAPGITERQALLLYDSYRRLVDPDQMGRKYKVLALVSTGHQGPAVAFPGEMMAKGGGGEEEEEVEEVEEVEEKKEAK